MTKPITILAMDDHPLVLKGITACAQQFSYVKEIRSCTQYNQLHTLLKECIPDLLLLDLNMPFRDGYLICKELKQCYPKLFIAILSGYSEQLYITTAQKCGAGAYLCKSIEAETLGNFLLNFAQGTLNAYPVYTNSGSFYKKTFTANDWFELKEKLTPREAEVFKLIAAGKNHKQIEDELHISYDTFKTHRKHIFEKLQVTNEAQLTAFAIKHCGL